MKRSLLIFSLILINNTTNAAGLYLTAGYGKTNTKLSATTLSGSSDDYVGIPGGPKHSNNTDKSPPNKDGYVADTWGAGQKELDEYNVDKGSLYSFAVGWQIPKNPFRFELEYQKHESDIRSAVTTIYVNNGKYIKTDATGTPISPAQEIPTDRYIFDIGLTPKLNLSVSAVTANVLFEIPGFGAIDPYVGYGIGKLKLENSNKNSVEGSDGYVNASQIIAGIEYRITLSPWIIGLEYKNLSSNFNEKDDGFPMKFENKSIMLKVKYDFVSNEI